MNKSPGSTPLISAGSAIRFVENSGSALQAAVDSTSFKEGSLREIARREKEPIRSLSFSRSSLLKGSKDILKAHFNVTCSALRNSAFSHSDRVTTEFSAISIFVSRRRDLTAIPNAGTVAALKKKRKRKKKEYTASRRFYNLAAVEFDSDNALNENAIKHRHT